MAVVQGNGKIIFRNSLFIVNVLYSGLEWCLRMNESGIPDGLGDQCGDFH